MRKIAFCVPNLGASQFNYCLIKRANNLLSTRADIDLSVFVESPCPPCLTVNFALYPIYEVWSYEGVCLASDHSTAGKIIAAPYPAKKIFYLWDLEWTRPHLRRPYREWAALYHHPMLSLLVRNEDHKKVVEDCWNRPVCGVVENVDVEKLLELLEENWP